MTLDIAAANAHNTVMKIPRAIKSDIAESLRSGGKVVVLFGPRQVGKTTLAKDILADWDGRVLEVSADEQRYIDVLSSRDSSRLHSFVAGYDLLFVDEAQRVPDVGVNLKILHDQIPRLKVLVTGSSSFDLAARVREPLTGRTKTYTLYPIAYLELANLFNAFELDSRLEERMVYGSYPEIFSIEGLDRKARYV